MAKAWGWLGLLVVLGCSANKRDNGTEQALPLNECATAVWFDAPLPCHCAGTDPADNQACSSNACRQFNVLMLEQGGQSYEFLAQDAEDLKAFHLPAVILSKGPWHIDGSNLVQQLPTRTLNTPVSCDRECLIRSNTAFSRMDAERSAALRTAVSKPEVPPMVQY